MYRLSHSTILAKDGDHHTTNYTCSRVGSQVLVLIFDQPIGTEETAQIEWSKDLFLVEALAVADSSAKMGLDSLFLKSFQF